MINKGNTEKTTETSYDTGYSQPTDHETGGNTAIDPITDNWFVATPYLGTTANIGKQLALLQIAVDAVLESVKDPLSAHGIRLGTLPVKAGDGNSLISDSLTINMTKGGVTAVHSIIIHNPTERIEPYRAQLPPHIFGVTELDAPRKKGALGSKVYLNTIRKVYENTDYKVPSNGIISPVIIEADLIETSPGIVKFNHHQSDLDGLIRRAIQILTITLGIKILHEFKDITIEKIVQLGGVIGVDVEETNTSFTTPDGILRHSKAIFNMSIQKTGEYNHVIHDPHNARASNHIGTAYVNTECRFVGGQQIQPSNFAEPTAPVLRSAWCPTLILEHTESANMPSLGVETMLSAIISGFMTTDILMSLFDNDIRYLNLVSNITGKNKQEPISKKVINDYFLQCWQGLMTDYWSFGIRIPEGAVTYGTQKDWLNIASGKPSYLMEHLAEIIYGKSRSAPREHLVSSKAVVQNFVDVAPQGTYVDKAGNTLPLSNIDVRFWLALLAEKQVDQSVVSAWMAACSMYTIEERMVIKSKLVQDFIPSAVITGMDYTVYLSDVIGLLQSKLTEVCNIKASGATSYQNITWNVHGANGEGLRYVGGSQSPYGMPGAMPYPNQGQGYRY